MSKQNLPDGWKNYRLEDLCEKISDGIHTTPEYTIEDTGFYFINGNNLKNQRIFITKKTKSVCVHEFDKHKKDIGDNTILMSINGTIGSTAYYNGEKVILGKSAAYINLKTGVSKAYVNYILNLPKTRAYFNSELTGSTIKNLSLKAIKKLPLNLPHETVQKGIVSILEQWDTAIEKTEALIDAKERQSRWLVTRLINKSEHEKKRLFDFISEVSMRNRGNEIDRVLSVTNRSGFVLPEEQFERRVASANVSNYKIVQQGQYAYNPSRINVGSIARLDDWDDGILSPMYTVFELNEKVADSDYFLHWLSSSEAKQRIKKSAQGSVRETVSFGDLGVIPICLPKLSVQQNIAATLNTAQQEINLLKKLAEQYRTQKRGLMQKLLSGKWRVKI